MIDSKQAKQIEAEILEILGCPIEKEMLSRLRTFIESRTDDETEYVQNFLERRRAAMKMQSLIKPEFSLSQLSAAPGITAESST
jgi:guanylate kinase